MFIWCIINKIYWSISLLYLFSFDLDGAKLRDPETSLRLWLPLQAVFLAMAHLLIYSLSLWSLVSSPMQGGVTFSCIFVMRSTWNAIVHKNMTYLEFFTNKAIIIIIFDLQLFLYAQHLCTLIFKTFILETIETLSLGTFCSPTQTMDFCLLPSPWPHLQAWAHGPDPDNNIVWGSADSDWSGSGNVTQAIAIRVSPSILFSETSRESSFSSLIKAHHGHDECQPSGDLVLYTLKIPERVKLTPEDKLHRQHPGNGKSPSQRFPVTATLPLHLWAFIYSYNEHVFKQVGIQFLSFVPKSTSDKHISLHKEKQCCSKKQQRRPISSNLGGVSDFQMWLSLQHEEGWQSPGFPKHNSVVKKGRRQDGTQVQILERDKLPQMLACRHPVEGCMKQATQVVEIEPGWKGNL